MRLSRLHSLLLCLWMAGLTACASVAKDLRLPFPAGPALEQPIVFELALFYPEPPREEPRAALDALLARDFPGSPAWTRSPRTRSATAASSARSG